VVNSRGLALLGVTADTPDPQGGKIARLIVLERDILTVDPESIEDTKAPTTYLDRRLVHSAQVGSQAEDDEEDEDAGKWWDEREQCMRDWLHRD
jgi:predicted amidohydrolase YtcJ